MTGQMMDGAPVARLQATDFLCCRCCDAGDTHSICHWNGAAWGEALYWGSGLLHAGSGGQGFVGGFWGIPVIEAARQDTDTTNQQDSASAQEHTNPDLSVPSGRVVDKIAEMDLRWEEDSLFNTGWHFQRRDEVKATVSKERMSPQIWMLLVKFGFPFLFWGR